MKASGSKQVTLKSTSASTDPRVVAAEFFALHRTWPDWVEDDEGEGVGVIGACESCSFVFLEGEDDDNYGMSEDGCRFCGKCEGELLAAGDAVPVADQAGMGTGGSR